MLVCSVGVGCETEECGCSVLMWCVGVGCEECRCGCGCVCVRSVGVEHGCGV